MNRDAVYQQLMIDEGVEYKIYQDHLGYLTFGIGHLIQDSDIESGQSAGSPVSEERVREVFDRDLDLAINECSALYGKGTFECLPGEVQEILVNMMFNMGRTRLSKFKKFNAAIADKDWATAAIEGRDSLWYRQVTNRAERLMVRLENIA